MKKALVLGVMAIFAINIANAQNKVVKKSADELKMEKEKTELTNAKAVEAKDATNVSSQKVVVNEEAPKNMVRETRAISAPTQERTDRPKQVGRQRPNLIQPNNANSSALSQPNNPNPSVSKLSAPSSTKNVNSNSLKPKHPTNPQRRNETGSTKTDK